MTKTRRWKRKRQRAWHRYIRRAVRRIEAQIAAEIFEYLRTNVGIVPGSERVVFGPDGNIVVSAQAPARIETVEITGVV